MRVTKSIAVLSALIAAVALAGCTTTSTAASGSTGSATPTSTFAAVPAEASGAGATVGGPEGPSPVTLTVTTPPGTRAVEVTVSCPGSDEWFVNDHNSDTSRIGRCGTATAILLPVTSQAATAALDVRAYTGGKTFEVTGIASTKRFVPDAGLAAFCTAFDEPASTLHDADGYYRVHASTEQQWRASVATAAAQLQKVAQNPGAPAWAITATEAIRTAVLAAAVGEADSADSADNQAITLGCTNNSSPLLVQSTVPGEG